MALRIFRQPVVVGLGLLAAVGLGGVIAVFMADTPSRLNTQIESGNAAQALNTLQAKLGEEPTSPVFNLLAAKARVFLCAQRNCAAEVSGTVPPLLVPLPKLLGNVKAPVRLNDKAPPLTALSVLTKGMQKFQPLTPQPQAVLALYQAAPAAYQPALAEGLFQPALALARQGNAQVAGEQLATLGRAEIPSSYTHIASILGGLFTDNQVLTESHLIALRNTMRNAVDTPPLPAASAALIPWALLAQAGNSPTITYPASVVLDNLPDLLNGWQAPKALDDSATAAIAAELAFIAHPSNTAVLAQWQKGWNAGGGSLPMALKRMSLSLNPNQPNLWAEYLPELITGTAAQSGTVPQFNFSMLSVASFTSATSQKLGGQLIIAAGRLKERPAVAAPLITLASRLNLARQQQIDLEKLTQELIVKATAQSDVTATLILAESQPGVAQNNRQAVVPLLVTYIRDQLGQGNFDQATTIANLLTNTLKMDVEFGPLILQEFTDDLKRRNIADQLAASTTDVLLEAPSQAQISLGPLFDFMSSYFEKQPDLITAQLTTLIAEARGTYGPATAMYRLGHLFPKATMPQDKQQQWLAGALNEELLGDSSLSGPQLANTTAELAERHPALAMAPLIEEAIKRATTLEDQRNLWQQATPRVKEVLRVIRPGFSALMRGIDAMGRNDFNTAAKEFATLTEPQWQTQAQAFIEQFHAKLAAIAGTYVPVSGAGGLKTAAIQLQPAGLAGGPLEDVSVTFISRVGTLTEPNTQTLSTNAAAVHSITFGVPLDFNTGTLRLTPQVMAQTAHSGTFNSLYGAVRTLSLQLPNASDAPTLMQVEGTPFMRAVAGSDTLRPDGTYLLQTRLSPVTDETAGLLPPGTMLTLSTGVDLQPAPFDTDLPATMVYPLTGTIRHPAGTQPMPVEGYFEPTTLTATFTYSYPLSHSGQLVKAQARCQALAGPVTCGAHHVHSPREAYATLITGLQTRESLTSAATARNRQNEATTQRLTEQANHPQQPIAEATTSSATATEGLLPPPNLASATAPVTETASPSTPAPAPAAASVPVPAESSPTAPAEAAAEEEDTAPASPHLIHSFVPDDQPTGVFIHKGVSGTNP